MNRLTRLDGPNIALWALLLWAAMNIIFTAFSVVRGGVLESSDSFGSNFWSIGFFAAVIFVHHVVVRAAPTRLRWAWFWLVTVLLAVLFGASLVAQTGPASHTYAASDLVVVVVLWSMICGPLIRFRLVDPAKGRRSGRKTP